MCWNNKILVRAYKNVKRNENIWTRMDSVYDRCSPCKSAKQKTGRKIKMQEKLAAQRKKYNDKIKKMK
jgi:hypothetical protein